MIRISRSSSAGSGNDSTSGRRKIVILSGMYSSLSQSPKRSGSSGILVLDDDRDVLERPGDARRQRVERPSDVLLELPLCHKPNHA